jgi:hypothetical protein
MSCHVGNYDEFSYIDSSLQCFNETEECEEVVLNKWQKTTRRQQKDLEFRDLFPVVTAITDETVCQ